MRRIKSYHGFEPYLNRSHVNVTTAGLFLGLDHHHQVFSVGGVFQPHVTHSHQCDYAFVFDFVVVRVALVDATNRNVGDGVAEFMDGFAGQVLCLCM